jgi:hypothetical protein
MLPTWTPTVFWLMNGCSPISRFVGRRRSGGGDLALALAEPERRRLRPGRAYDLSGDRPTFAAAIVATVPAAHADEDAHGLGPLGGSIGRVRDRDAGASGELLELAKEGPRAELARDPYSLEQRATRRGATRPPVAGR